MKFSEEKVAALRELRNKKNMDGERLRLRHLYGGKFASAVASGANMNITLADFDVNMRPPFEMSWPSDIVNAEGLVAAYISEPEILRILMCIEELIPEVDGLIGFHEKDYLGLASLKKFHLMKMQKIVKLAEDSALFFPSNFDGVVFADFYPGQPEPRYSLIVQGQGLVERLSNCFHCEKF